MPPTRNTRFSGRRRTHLDQTDQGFQKLHEPESFRLLRTTKRTMDNSRSVLRVIVSGEFPGFHHVELNGVLHDVILQDGGVSPPRRYLANLENVTLDVVFTSGAVNMETGATETGQENDYDDYMDNAFGNGSDDYHQSEDREDFDDEDDQDGGMNSAINDYTEAQVHASLNIQSLTRPSTQPTGPHSSISLNAFAFPMQDELGIDLPIEQSSWKVFKACDCVSSVPETGGWDPHLISEGSYGIVEPKKATRFIQLFGPVLHSRAEWFLRSLRGASSSADPAPMSDRNLVLSHLCRELRLTSNDQVEPYLERAIKGLKDGIASYHMFGTHTSSKQLRLTRSDRNLFSFYPTEEGSNAMDVDDVNITGAYLVADSLGREHFVCRHHHKRLYPMFVPGHAGDQTSDVAAYDVHTGKLSAILKSGAELIDLCSIVPAKVGFVSKLDITVDWEASMDELRRLHEFVASLGITDMTISGGDGREVPDIPDQVEAETHHVREILRNVVTDLRRVSVKWGAKLDLSNILQDVSSTRENLLHLVINDSRQEMSSVMLSGHLGVRRVKSSFEDLPLVSRASFLAGKAQSLEIPSAVQWNQEKKGIIFDTIQKNLALTSLILDCKPSAHGLKSTVSAIETINKELSSVPNPRQPLRRLVLKHNVENDIAAVFDISLPPSKPLFTKPVALDVTARSSTSLSSVIKAYGSSIRVLHLIGDTPGCPTLLEDLFESEAEPDKLMSLTLLLDHVKGTNVDALVKLQLSSKKTFRQLALIAQPQDDDATNKILRSLEVLDETIKGAQVIVTRTQTAGVERWIQKVQRAMVHAQESTLIVVESAEELVRIVPSFTEAGLDCLKTIFARSEMPARMQGEQVVKMAAASSLATSKSPEGQPR